MTPAETQKELSMNGIYQVILPSENQQEAPRTGVYNVRDYGAKTDPLPLQTEAFQKAIDACAAAGGGTVLVPPGIYRIGTIRLRSHVTLRLENGALLRGPDSIDDYFKYPFAWELYSHTMSLIYAVGERNIRICGEGKIDFNGIAFANTEKLCIGDDVPESLHTDAHYEMPGRDFRPNRLLFFSRCDEIEISGVTFVDSPTWTLVFDRCSNLRLHDFQVRNNMRIPNNDGIHCCGCRDVLIRGCLFECGDDCIALTSISRETEVNENILISDCIFRSASAAIRIGFQGGKIRNVLIQNCIIRDSNRGIAVFAGKGGWVENVSVDSVMIETRIYAGSWWGKGEPMTVCSSEESATIRNLSLRNAVIRSENGFVVSCVNASVSNLVLENLNMEIGYGTRRPWFGRTIDLAPNPSKDAPDPRRHIPWLWSEGNAGLCFRNISVQRRPGEKIPFDEKEWILK